MPAKGTRPTSDRVREAVFNALAARIEFSGLSVLDLYAGSGALGLEALSRGASSALFVESDQRAAAVITANLAALGVGDAGAVLVRRGSVDTVLAAGASRPVDLVFADPPYDLADAAVESMLSVLSEAGWVSDGAFVLVERRASGRPVGWPDGWQVLSSRRYGDTRVELAEVGPPGGR